MTVAAVPACAIDQALPVAAFVSYAKEPLPDLFLGHLAIYITSTARPRPPCSLFLVGEGTIIDFSAQSFAAAVKEPIVGLGFTYVDDRNGASEPSLRFWFHSSVEPDTVRARAAALVDHALPNQRSATSSFMLMASDEIEEAKPKWPFKIYALPRDALPVDAPHVFGSPWLDDATGEMLVMDHAIPNDAPAIVAGSSMGSSVPYILNLIAHPLFSTFLHVVRVVSTGQPVAWCVVHTSFVLGLVFTEPAFRRRGLGRFAVAAAMQASSAYVASCDEGIYGLQPHCFITDANLASQAMFGALGFVPAVGGSNRWLGSA
ncbi:Aste57867_25359 [Aphanomyces stellatus]|uniref:Aste57867_25359 protein n=1 Tax=Aphanomyces stellatus TaxID=120398 RepID=A0A485LSW2_9STRA|nr:hypothetical protein As57867_025281 [Aphanomyces stellatus]VFU01984.1 Aste57867_25359 [Aphanomyces stellatus]